MANPLFQVLGGQAQGFRMPDRQQIEQAQAQMRQQGRDPAREWEALKRSGRMTPQQISLVEQLSQNLARKIYGK